LRFPVRMQASTTRRASPAIAAAAFLAVSPARAASEDLDFITEHLAEVAMNNGAASLPLWQRDWRETRAWRGYLSGGYHAIAAQAIDLEGSLVSGAVEHVLSANWSVRGAAFAESATLSGTPGVRLLKPIFLNPLPAGLPATAVFGRLDGQVGLVGAGVTATWRNHAGWMDGSEWMGGLVWQQLSIDHSTTTYRLVDGPAAGSSGTIGYDSRFTFYTLVAGMQWHRRYAGWLFSPHWHVTLPLPRGAVAGRLTAPGVDATGDSALARNGHHLGDGYLSLGLSVTWLPAHVTVDLGTTLSQYFLEPVVDKGIDRDLMLAVEWNF
jgi:hypothetical protein